MKKTLRRFVSAVCAAAMLAGGAAVLPANAAEVQSAKIMGDLNGDRHITLEDAKIALDLSVQSMIGLVDSKTDVQTNAGDINMNGKIEVMDALAILRYFCQTLVGDQPLWSDIRKVTYHDGTEYDPFYMKREEGEESPAHLPFERRGMYLEIGCAEGKAGETVTVPVYVAGITKLTAFEYVQLIPDGLTLTKIHSGFAGEDFDYAREYDEETGGYGWIKTERTLEQLMQASVAAAVNDELGIGAFAWMTLNGVEMDMKEGSVIAEFTYQIPEDAKSGDTFILTADTKKMRFNQELVELEDGSGEFHNYQYTMLDGVVAVK